MKHSIINFSAVDCSTCQPEYKNRDSTLKCKLCILQTYPVGSQEAKKIIEQIEEVEKAYLDAIKDVQKKVEKKIPKGKKNG